MEYENYVRWEEKPVEDCFHVYSDGTRMAVLFDTDEDKIHAMNLLPILARHFGIRIYCIIVMDTHFHLVVCGPQEQVGKMVGEIKRLLGRYFRSSGRSHFVEDGIRIGVDAIPTEEELMGKIIYVFRNNLDAGGRFLPEDYRWGIGSMIFHHRDASRYHRVGNLGIKEREQLFQTRVSIPDNWLYDDAGMLVPFSYIDVDYIERLFGSPKRYIAFLHIRKKDLARHDEECARKFVEENDLKQLRKTADKHGRSLYNRPVQKLSQVERLSLAKTLWQNRATFSRKQLARAVHLSPDLIETVFH